MCTQRPCKCSVDLVRIADIDAMWKGDGQSGVVPGRFFIGWVNDGERRYRQFWVGLPCEGGELHGLSINGPGENVPDGIGRPMWQWDGNEEKPTLTPSVLTWRRKDPEKPDTPDNRQEVWHGFIKVGRAESC